MQEITSKENQLIKKICKLKEKKYRNEYKEYLIEGIKIVKEAIDENTNIKYIFINQDQALDENLKKQIEDISTLKSDNCINVPGNIFKKISNVETPQGVLAVIGQENEEKKINFSEDIILALDDIQDPGNLGTIIRTVDSVGLSQILLSKGTVDAHSPKVIRSTMGAIFRVNIIESEDIIDTLKNIQKNGYKLMVTSLQSEKSLYETKLNKKLIVIGNEANGVRQEINEIADEKIKIPMIGKTESLNASVATGVVLYEYLRQKINILQ